MLSLATVVATLLRLRARACVVLACLAAILCATSIASAQSAVQAQTRVWDFSFASPLNIRLNAPASQRLHPENRIASAELASDSPHAARGAGAAAPKLLPAARQVEAAFGASVYKHGGLMTTMEHIFYRHAANSGFSNVSRFASGTTAREVSGYIDTALRYGTVTAQKGGGYMIEHTFAGAIGTAQSGAAASSIRVFVRDGVIKTAFPF